MLWRVRNCRHYYYYYYYYYYIHIISFVLLLTTERCLDSRYFPKMISIICLFLSLCIFQVVSLKLTIAKLVTSLIEENGTEERKLALASELHFSYYCDVKTTAFLRHIALQIGD